MNMQELLCKKGIHQTVYLIQVKLKSSNLYTFMFIFLGSVHINKDIRKRDALVT